MAKGTARVSCYSRFRLRVSHSLPVGDFGLATSALAVVDPTDMVQTPVIEADMTLGK
jgi:hypothetical protein